MLALCQHNGATYYAQNYAGIISASLVGGAAGQAMAGPVLGLTKQYIGLEVVISTIKLYCSLCFKSVGSLPQIVFHTLSQR